MSAPPSAIPLLTAWENFLKTHPDGDLPAFARWVLTQHSPGSTAATGLDDTKRSTLLINRLHNILRFFSKQSVKELGFTREHEFSALVHVTLLRQPNKKELCREMLIENSTGVEVTKRLAKRGFIKEEADPNDRRSARLSLTDKGMATLVRGYEKLAIIHRGFLDPLSPEERQTLVSLLSRLNDHHTARLDTPGSSGPWE